MLDPLTAIGLASAIVQFFDFSTKLVHDAKEIYESTSGATEANRGLEVVVDNMKNLYSTLKAEDPSLQSDAELALCRIAKECDSLSIEIFEILQKVKPKKSNSFISSSSTAIKSMWYAGKIADLKATLDSYRGQLALPLSVVTSSEAKASLDMLLQSAKDDATKLEQLQRRLERLRRGVTVRCFSSQAQKQLQELLGISEHACQLLSQQRILKSLAFQDMHGRFETVPDAHKKTFEWLLDDTAPNQGVEDHSSTRELFIDWLSSGKGIFHISGKLGSGKSTLMKYLCGERRTTTELQKWADDRKLILANFFFWRPGTVLQKSLAGLFRSLLHDILIACPELTPKVFPELWDRVKLLPWQVQTELTLSKTEIQTAFAQLIKNQQLYQDLCFCFFIDGLDEYVGTHEEDHLHMTQLLRDWANAAPEGVKICVSSREDNVFLNAFSGQQRIRLQDLTRADMERYIRDNLADIDDEETMGSLVQNITDKAKGIFLWVALAVKSIRQRLQDGYQVSEIEKELDSLPQDLEKLFKRLLESIDKSAQKKKGYQTFAMMPKLEPYNLGLSLLHYSFLDDYEKDPEFAMKPSLANYSMDHAAQIERLDLARRKLNGDCKGLLEAPEDVIVFTHRSIPEFLYREDIQAEMKSHLKCFCPKTALSQLLLAEIRFIKSFIQSFTNGERDSRRDAHYENLLIYAVLDMRLQVKADHEPYYFQEYLNSVTLEDKARGPDECKASRWVIVTERRYSICIGSTNNAEIFETPLSISAYLGDHEYVAWKTRKSFDVLGSNFETRRLLAWAIEGGAWDDRIGCFEILKSFLKQRQAPNARISDESLDLLSGKGAVASVWQHFICWAVLRRPREGNPRTRKIFGEVFKMFLEYGADPHIWALSHPGWSKPVELIIGRERCSISLPGYQKSGILDSKGGELSLRDMIKCWHPDNTATLLQLLDKDVEHQEQASHEENKTPGFAGLEPENEKHATALQMEEDIVSERLRSSTLLVLQSWFKSPEHGLLLMVALSILLAVFSSQLWAIFVR